ncbi:MFS transporter [Demequina sp. NBRC 110056]|uniref:MFS transporter n=1 Tax=Demequina sp. NBRC 110056 TaxID=1570345 RepID=UPI0009FDBBE1|nr:MFS transporter [Demequina sp. NBRC 110056]
MTDLPSLIPAGTPRWRLPRSARDPHAWHVLAAFAAVGFGVGLTQNGAAGVVQDQVADLGTTVDALGWTMVAYSLGVVVGAPLLMVGLGRMGRRPLLLWMSGTFLVTTVATVLAPTVEALMAIRFLAGLPHGALLGTASFVAMTVMGAERRGRAVAIIMLGLTSSLVVGVPFMQWMSNAAGWRAAYGVVAAVALIAAVGVWAFTPDVPGNPHASPRAELRALRGARLWTAIIATTVGFSGLGAVFSYIVPLLEVSNGLEAGQVTWVLAIWGAAMTAGAYLGGRLTDRSHVGAGRLGLAGAALALAGIGLVGDVPALTIGSLVLLAASMQVFSQSSQVHLMDVMHGSPSLGSALAHAALNAATAVGTGLGAIVIGAGLGYQAPAWVALGLAAVAMVIVVLGPGYRGRGGWRRPAT